MFIGRLTGRVVDEEPEGIVVVDVGGVGYQVVVPLGTLGRAGSDDGVVTLFVHTHVTDKSITLYGFASATDKRVFQMVLSAPRTGPKTGIDLLSEFSGRELVDVVAEKDVTRLCRARGIGKTSATTLVNALESRVGVLRASFSADGGAAPAPTASNDTERLVGALTNMGYKRAEAERAVASLGDRVGSAPLSDLLREALAKLV